MKPSQSIFDDLAPLFTCSTAMRLLCLTWIVPAVSLVWIGFASVGLRNVEDAHLVRSLERVQAGATMLTIFGCLIGLIWALRTMDYLPAMRRIGSGSRLRGPISHLAAALLGVTTGLVATTGSTPRPGVTIVAVVSGLYAVSLVARWVLRSPLDPSLPLALLSLAAGFQLTVGWLHVMYPDGRLAPLLVVEGLALAWIALAAARVVAAVGSPAGAAGSAATATVAPSTATAASGSAVAVELISQAPAQPSLRGPAVGR